MSQKKLSAMTVFNFFSGFPEKRRYFFRVIQHKAFHQTFTVCVLFYIQHCARHWGFRDNLYTRNLQCSRRYNNLGKLIVALISIDRMLWSYRENKCLNQLRNLKVSGSVTFSLDLYNIQDFNGQDIQFWHS